jgi:hypothetical protein
VHRHKAYAILSEAQEKEGKQEHPHSDGSAVCLRRPTTADGKETPGKDISHAAREGLYKLTKKWLLEYIVVAIATEETMPEKVAPYEEPVRHAALGQQPLPHQPKEVWRIDVYGSVPHIDPMTYFMTSGEAVVKAKRLEADLWQAAAKARKFANLLQKTKGKNKYLELELVGGGIVLVKTKNSRPNPRLLMKKPNDHPSP